MVRFRLPSLIAWSLTAVLTASALPGDGAPPRAPSRTPCAVANDQRAAACAWSAKFDKFTDYQPAAPVFVMPGERLLHRFFDTSPISPSGRYLAAFRLPGEHSPRPGEAGEVVLIDLVSGTERVVARSRGWEIQVGANVQWGRSDAELYFNDVDPRTWRAFAVRLNPATGARCNLEGTVFMVAPNGTALVSHNLVKSRLVQPGYGVVVPDDRVTRNIGPVADDGLYVTDTHTGRTRMLVSLKTIYEQAVPSIQIPQPDRYEYYCFQAKWNRQGTRLLTTVQWTPVSGGKRRRAVITMNADGSDIRTAVTADLWARGGHHINWCPDGIHLSMNLCPGNDRKLEICSFRYDGSELRRVAVPGSGHPSFDPSGRYLMVDAYPHEPVAYGDGSVPLRLVDTQTGTCTVVARVYVSKTTGEFRLDPHPAWDASGQHIVFNALLNGTRRVCVADLSGLVK